LNARKPRKPTPERLANGALAYLARYAASEAGLRRVLQNKIRRYNLKDPVFAADAAAQATCAAAIETIVEKHKRLGVLNDAAFAEMKVHSMRRAGKSARRITQSLAQKGVAAPLIEQALTGEEGKDPAQEEEEAARSFAKKRGLGVYRKGGASADRAVVNKEIASMARAGFSFDMIQKVLGAEPEEPDDFL